MVYYAGIDLGKRKSHIKVITAEREVLEDLMEEGESGVRSDLDPAPDERGHLLEFDLHDE